MNTYHGNCKILILVPRPLLRMRSAFTRALLENDVPEPSVPSLACSSIRVSREYGFIGSRTTWWLHGKRGRRTTDLFWCVAHPET